MNASSIGSIPTSIKVKNLSKVFQLSQKGGGAVSLREALRQSRQQTTQTRELRALDNISFTIHDSERVGIIGPNGAGKTTLLSLLAGLTEPTSGTIEVEGDLHAMLTIGAVLREELSGRENIYLDATIHGRSQEQIDAAAEKIIAFTELDDFIDRPVRTYSSGMKARVAFAMGAFINSDILILDETLAVGDVFFAEKAGKRMKELADSGRIVILVTHATGAIVEMCTRCLWIDQGRIVMDGDPKTVTSAYEASVRQADEQALKRKFGTNPQITGRPEAGRIDRVEVMQNDQPRQASVAAFQPLEIVVSGQIATHTQDDRPVLEFSLLRVDGRQIWRFCPDQPENQPLPTSGPFTARICFNPFILGANLYRLDVTMKDNAGVCDLASRVFEVIDEEGQFGGQPQLFYAPKVTSHLIEKAKLS